jgi:uncharacterized membrane protein YccC
VSHSATWPRFWQTPLRLGSLLRPVLPLVLYGIRFWVAVCLALWIAFYLELDNPSWAGTSAALVCQPVLGASLRKGWFRMVGTVIGACAIVVITGLFPQSRVGFLIVLAVWGAACGLVATLLRNFASYAAALAGYTAAIVATDELGAVGGPNGQAFILAVTRASEICIGIVCAGVVLASTDFGAARQRLGNLLATLTAEIAGGVVGSLSLVGPAQAELGQTRRTLIRRVSALDPVIDQALGEISALRFHPRRLQAAVDGLFAAVAAWRTISVHLENTAGAGRDAAVVDDCLPEVLRVGPANVLLWQSQPLYLRNTCFAAVRRLLTLRVGTPSIRLLADHLALALLGIRNALTGLMVLADPRGTDPGPGVARLRVPDVLPSIVNALRALVAIVTAQLFWIGTGWPTGAAAMLWVAIVVTLLSPQGDAAYATAMKFTAGTAISACLATVIEFAVLPQQTTFLGFAFAIGFVLVPVAALTAQSWQTPVFVAMSATFIPLLGPTNQMNYDTAAFYNSELALVAGTGLGVMAMRLIPPVPPEQRARRLLTLTLRDLRRLAVGPLPSSTAAWESRVYGRLSAIPDQVELLQGARLVAALTAGYEIIRLRRIASRFDPRSELDAACKAIARGDSASAIEDLRRFDDVLAAVPATTPGSSLRLRIRSIILAIAEVLAQHASYFDAKI